MWEIIEGTRGEHDSRRHKDYDYTSRGPRMGYSSSHYGKKYDEEEIEEMLEEAYINPEDHKNLVVRVGGYSDYFYRLSDELKRMIINRTIQNEV